MSDSQVPERSIRGKLRRLLELLRCELFHRHVTIITPWQRMAGYTIYKRSRICLECEDEDQSHS